MASNQVVLFPFMAQGHITPFLAFADLLCRRRPDLAVTLVSTPFNIRSIRSTLPSDSPLRLRPLPFVPSDHGLPPNADNASLLPHNLFSALFRASESLRPHFHQLLLDLAAEDGGRLPLCLVGDNFLGWTVEVARDLGVFHSVFLTGGAYGFSIMFSFWLDDSNGPGFLNRQTKRCLKSQAMLGNTVEELEISGLKSIREIVKIPVFPVGPLIRTPNSSSSPSSADKNCMEWLDSRRQASVLYISFGSQNSINSAQMMELAAGLELSGAAFVWAIRPPAGFDAKAELRPEWLPEKFEKRMEEKRQGILLHAWAPQLEILSHPATRAFLSHCGWNSVLESLSRGVPIIGWPLAGDQMYNSEMLEEEVGVCVEMARGNWEVGKVGREGVRRVVETVMGETEKGKEMRRRAGKVREMMRAALEVGDGCAGSSARGLEEFLKAAVEWRCSRSNER